MKVENIPVVVVGGGSAAFEAAVAAKQAGAPKVVMLEKAPEPEFGGNARFSHTGFRWVFSGADEIRQFVPDLDETTFRKLHLNGLHGGTVSRRLTACDPRADRQRTRRRGRAAVQRSDSLDARDWN